MTHPAVAALDRQIAQKGEPVVLRRLNTVPNQPAQPPTDVATRAFCRGFKPQEIVGGIVTGESVVIVSPTGLGSWPAPPRINDQIIYQGRTRSIRAVAPVVIGEDVIRYDLRVAS